MGALMISLDIRHPDSPEFAISKRDLTKITGANISLKVSKDFMDAVEKDEDYILRYPCDLDLNKFSYDYIDANYNELHYIEDHTDNNKICYVKKVKAKELWDTIIESNWKSAEPGILFWDNIVDYDPAGVYPEYRPISTNPSLRKGTRVLTSEGIFPIDSLQDKDLVVPNSNGELKNAKCFLSGDNEPLYKVSLKGGHDYYCTAEHKWPVGNKKVLTKDLEPGMYLPLTKKDKLFEGSLGTYEDGLFIGWLYGDGWYTVRGDNGKTQIGMVVNYEEYEFIVSKIKEYLDFHCGKDVVNFNKRSNGTYEFNTTNENLISHLNKFKIGNKSEGFPKTIWVEGSEEYRKGFIDGLISADGSITKTGGIHFVSSQEKLATDLKELLGFYGIKSSYKHSENTSSFPNGKDYDKLYQRYDVKIGDSFSINHFISLFKLTNKLKADKLVGVKEPTDYRAKYKDLIRIQSIELTDLTEPVWDMTVYDETHNFHLAHTITGNCGEIPLGAYDACRLIATNVYSLVANPFLKDAYLDEELAYKVFYEAQVIADTLVDIELEHIQRIIDLNDESDLWKKVYQIGANGRRTGTGITALGDLCAALNVPYGQPEVVKQLMSIKLRAELDASIDLAIIEGPFPAWDREKEFDLIHSDTPYHEGKNSWYKFISETYPEQTERMIKYGRRNISLSTIAPTGSLSILAGTSSGCEPVFSLYYQRRKKCNSGEVPDFIDQNGVGFKNYMVIHPKFRDWFRIKYGTELEDDPSLEILDHYYKQSPWYGQTANDLTPLQRIETQSILQKYTTHSISSTVNLPEDVSIETVNELYQLGYTYNLKGLTTYRAGSRSGILVQVDQKSSLTKDRPSELPCKVLRFKNEKKSWIAFVGVNDERPYEIFTGINDLDSFPIPSYIEEGVIIKVPSEGRSRYDFRYVDNYGYTNTLGGLNRIFNKEYWNYARFVSALLREGTEIENIINIIEKLEFSNKTLNSWQFGIIRALKSFIEDGTESEEACLECGEHSVIYEAGCKVCKSCGSSKCG